MRPFALGTTSPLWLTHCSAPRALPACGIPLGSQFYSLPPAPPTPANCPPRPSLLKIIPHPPPLINLSMVFGLKGDVKDNIHYIDETTVVYPAGQNVIIYNMETKAQKFLPSSPENQVRGWGGKE